MSSAQGIWNRWVRSQAVVFVSSPLPGWYVCNGENLESRYHLIRVTSLQLLSDFKIPNLRNGVGLSSGESSYTAIWQLLMPTGQPGEL